ncbi:hypothetical protein RHMOL_Rhmol13G0160000 [Rhododendron molle]|uniref:Uncharacterized protein n=1 Tax=Rhododendron molle TaxID=49168 RepID=A0ACC0L866_RHOML|nr:hypothetical protein RHMOL_Rhmol13G0160000 [Rhododendron molle]
MKAHRTTNTNSTEEPSITGWRCGKWVFRSTNVRKSRGKPGPLTPISKRKRAVPSPTSSANSVIGENNVEVGHPGAAKYHQKGLDHYDLLQELLESSLANGALG